MAWSATNTYIWIIEGEKLFLAPSGAQNASSWFLRFASCVPWLGLCCERERCEPLMNGHHLSCAGQLFTPICECRENLCSWAVGRKWEWLINHVTMGRHVTGKDTTRLWLINSGRFHKYTRKWSASQNSDWSRFCQDSREKICSEMDTEPKPHLFSRKVCLTIQEKAWKGFFVRSSAEFKQNSNICFCLHSSLCCWKKSAE